MKEFILIIYSDISLDMRPWFRKLVAWPITILIFIICCIIAPPFAIMVLIALGITKPIEWLWKIIKPLFFKLK